jgi:hypothetical protein
MPTVSQKAEGGKFFKTNGRIYDRPTLFCSTKKKKKNLHVLEIESSEENFLYMWF